MKEGKVELKVVEKEEAILKLLPYESRLSTRRARIT